MPGDFYFSRTIMKSPFSFEIRGCGQIRAMGVREIKYGFCEDIIPA